MRPDGFYVDCTFGRGGHSRAILDALDGQGRLLVFDKDVKAIEYARVRFSQDPRFISVHGSFSSLLTHVSALDRLGKTDGVLLDLGVSSPQLDEEEAGFSFQRDGFLDMRMDRTSGITASEWINSADTRQLEQVIREYGEEKYARRIARAIDLARQAGPITHTLQLAEIIAESIPTREQGKNPATRSFQAIRIFINSELEDLKAVLSQVQQALRPGGRLVVLSFHSLEDRIVKQFMQHEARGDDFPPDLPVLSRYIKPRLKIISKGIRPDAAEIRKNPRARSAVLRVAEKLAA